jgi:hypothetical protein
MFLGSKERTVRRADNLTATDLTAAFGLPARYWSRIRDRLWGPAKLLQWVPRVKWPGREADLLLLLALPPLLTSSC